MLELDLATILFQVINFLVLVVVLNRFLFKPLRAKLNERSSTISETLEEARTQETEASRLQAEWEERIQEAEEEAEEIVSAARTEASERSTDLMEEARERLDQMTEEMRLDLYRQRNEIVTRHYDDILDTIIDLSGNVVRSVTTRRAHDDLVTNFAANIYQMSQPDVEEYRRMMRGRVPTAFVVTPVALTADQTETLTDTLSSLIDRRVELDVKEDPSLIAGIQVRLGDKVIDNSIRQQLSEIRGRVREDLISRMEESGQYE